MRFYLIRHGQTEWNIEGKVQGKTDIALNETGLLQARLLAGALSDCPAGTVYSSSLKRARQTASVIAEEKGLPVFVTEDLREADFGLWEGKTWEEIAKTYPETAGQWEANPALATPDGGERMEDCQSRCRRIIERILSEREAAGEDSVILVAHGRILVFVMGYLLRNQREKPELITKNASISVIEYERKTGAGHLTALNDCRHLAGMEAGKTNKYC